MSTVALRAGETLANYAIRVTDERDEARVQRDRQGRNG